MGGLLAERRGLERAHRDARVLLGPHPRGHRRQGLHHGVPGSGALVAAHRALRYWGYLLCYGGVCHEHDRVAGRRRLLDDEILAELTGEKPTTAPPAGQQEKGFE